MDRMYDIFVLNLVKSKATSGLQKGWNGSSVAVSC